MAPAETSSSSTPSFDDEKKPIPASNLPTPPRPSSPLANDDEKSQATSLPLNQPSSLPAQQYDVQGKESTPDGGQIGTKEGAKTEINDIEVNTASVEAVDGEEDAQLEFPGGLQLALLTFGLCLAVFSVALDNTIIATAIPRITDQFNSLNDVGWYGSSYLLTTTALQPSFGKVYTYFDVKFTYLIVIVIFEVGSILCAAARNSVMLIIGRAVAGAGAAGIFSGGMTIIGFSVPLSKRPMYLAAVSSMFGISSVVGPLLGGVLTDRASWRWCFWINLPFGAIAIIAVSFFFKSPRRKQSGLTVKQRVLEIDLLGGSILTCAVVCLLLALQWGGSTYPWSSSKVWGCLLGFGLLIIIFIAQQFRRGDRATIPPRIFGQRTVLFSCLFSCFLAMGQYTHIFYLPFYFQAIKGTTAEGSGIRNIPYLGTVILASIITGGGVTVVGYYTPFVLIGSSIFTIGAGLIYTLAVNSSTGRWIGYQLLCGFGSGLGIQVPFIAVQVVLSAKDMPSGNAIAMFWLSLGGAISISVAQNIFSNDLVKYITEYAPEVSAQEVIAAGATHLREAVPAASLPAVLKAYNMALDKAFTAPIAYGILAFICACFVEWKSVKGKKIVATAA